MNKLSFLIFLTVFLTLYGLLHLYFYLKWRAAMPPGLSHHWTIPVILLLFTAMPILTSVSARHEFSLLSILTAHVGYIWMGFLFLFLAIHLLLDLFSWLPYLGSLASVIIRSIGYPGEMSKFVGTILMATGIMVYGLYEASHIEVRTVVLKTEKLAGNLNPLKIAQISDLHLSAVNGPGLARKIVGIIEEIQPQILVMTGDLLDRGITGEEEVVALFRNLEIPFGKYAVTGNHEFYTGIHEAVKFMKRSGFRVLRNEGITINGVVNMVGVDDKTSKRFDFSDAAPEWKILESLPKERFTILLKHQPRVDQKSLGRFDLQLSGHTHRGQIFPFSLITELAFPFHHGLYRAGEGSLIYVSGGTGTWGPPVRFLAPPELTLIEIHRKSEKTE
jgi:predicted MPP superfamily phosphohydrolase